VRPLINLDRSFIFGKIIASGKLNICTPLARKRG